ncbi:MAG: DUF4380 domain-containing protein [Chloroflexi bacterium]|nr:DUF4380 domain-containing protein [Chloroflexota bacterium]
MTRFPAISFSAVSFFSGAAMTALLLTSPLATAPTIAAPTPRLERAAPHASGKRVTITREAYHGWQDCYRMTSGKVNLVVVPDAGGRIMEYSLDGENALFANRAEEGKVYPITATWHNYGGFKNWNAPQDRWNWPPDPYLDFGKASVEVINPSDPSPVLRVTGAASIAAGLVFQRDITMDPLTGDVTIQQSLYNIGPRAQQWSVWGIAQVPYPCIVAAPINPQSVFPGGVESLSDGRKGESSQWHTMGSVLIARPSGLVGKIGFDNNRGWLAYFRDHLAYVQRIPALVPDAAYPDKGANAELYTNSKDVPYVEMEQLSPLFNLPPGASGQLTEQWQIRNLRRGVRSDSDVTAALRELGLGG